MYINSITLIYVSPNAVVSNPAVAPDITPPAAVPIPGINLRRLDTIVLPRIVAPAEPIVDDTKPVKKLLLMSSPNIAVIVAIIVTCVGTSIAESENGIGANPSPNDAATAVAMAACAYFFFRLK